MKQKKLETRNQLLEKVAALNRQPSTGSNSPSLTSSELPSWQVRLQLEPCLTALWDCHGVLHHCLGSVILCKPSKRCFLQTDADSALKGLTVESERGPQITITILDEDKVFTVKEAGNMTIRDFASYYSVRLLLYLCVPSCVPLCAW